MGDALPFSRWSFFAVFDGHAGSVAAEYAASIVVETLKESEKLRQVKSRDQMPVPKEHIHTTFLGQFEHRLGKNIPQIDFF